MKVAIMAFFLAISRFFSLTSHTTVNVDPAIGYLEIRAGGNITIDSTSGIYADAITCGPADGQSSGAYSYGGGGGGGHRNEGGTSYSSGGYVYGGSEVGSLYMLKYMTGSCGGANKNGTAGGKGGGAIILYGSDVELKGTLSAKGEEGVYSYYGGTGGGSGGSITLFGGTIDIKDSAHINVDGGVGGTAYSSTYYGG
ncbi:MAG TPA: hypothetical protein ENN58_03160, partial [bacterium]|nr:hypothetical protein [bacterium]